MSLYALPLALEQGIDFQSPTFALFQADGISPLNLRGFAARLVFRINRQDPAPQLSLTTAVTVNGRVTIDPVNGLVSFTVTKLGTQQFTDWSGTYDLVIDSGDVPSVSTKVAHGTWFVARAVAQ